MWKLWPPPPPPRTEEETHTLITVYQFGQNNNNR